MIGVARSWYAGPVVATPKDPSRVLPIVRAGYRVHLGEHDWLQHVAEASGPALDHGLGVIVTTFDAGSRAFRYTAAVGVGTSPGVVELGSTLHEQMGESHVAVMRRALGVTTASVSFGPDFVEREGAFPRVLHQYGIRDMLGVGGADTDGHGIYISVPLSARVDRTVVPTDLLMRVAVHLLCAFRLRRAMNLLRKDAEDRGGVEATLDRRGRVVSAEDDVDSTARDELRAALRNWSEAQQPGRSDGDAPLLALWAGLVSGRWTLLDTFESSGERLVVARRNDPVVPTGSGLSTRARQIVWLLAAGRSPKEVAYELGLADSTVRTLVSRAQRRLGASSLAQMIEVVERDELAAVAHEPSAREDARTQTPRKSSARHRSSAT